MKKLLFLFFLLPLFLISCASPIWTIWYDKDMDREMSSELIITGGIAITHFNNQSVSMWGDTDKSIKVLVIIPPGTYSVGYAYRPYNERTMSSSDYVYSSSLEYTFKAGHKYSLVPLTADMASSMNISWREGMLYIIDTTYLESPWL